MTTPDYVQVPPNVPGGPKVDTARLAVGPNLVERQVIVLGDSIDPAGYVPVIDEEPDSSDYGLVVRPIPGDVAWPTLERSGLVPLVYDHIDLTYSGLDLTGVGYRTGGPSGAVVGSLTIGYTSGAITSITRT